MAQPPVLEDRVVRSILTTLKQAKFFDQGSPRENFDPASVDLSTVIAPPAQNGLTICSYTAGLGTHYSNLPEGMHNPSVPYEFEVKLGESYATIDARNLAACQVSTFAFKNEHSGLVVAHRYIHWKV